MQNESKFKITHFTRHFLRYKRFLAAGLLALILAKAAATFEPIFLRNIIDQITQNEAAKIIFFSLGLYFAARILSIIFEFLRDWFFSPFIMGVVRDFENQVYAKLLDLPVSYHADQKTGAAARSIARGSQALSFVLDFTVSQFLPPIFELIFVMAVLLKLYTWQYALITLATIIVYTVFTVWSTDKRQVYRRAGNQKDDEASGILVDSITNIETVKYFSSENYLYGLYSKIKNGWFELLVKNNRLFGAIFGAQGLILLAGLGLILYLAITQSISGAITVGSLVLVSTYIVRLSAPIATLGFVYGEFKNSISDIQAMEKILETPVDIKEPLKPTAIKKSQGQVEFKNVSFAYPNGKNIFENLSFSIRPGEKVAFVGPSGAGKSTITRLLFRLFDVSAGEVIIDSVNVKKISSAAKSMALAVVPQDPALFNDTICNNISFGRPNAGPKDIARAAKQAQIYDFIKSLPQGLDTMVGERGVKISGGERQRVAIARAIIKNPKVLVFDEATSSLDSRKEAEVLETINKVAKGRTTISIAHRLSTIVSSDVIYVLDRGQIVESGTHRELLKQNGLYEKLWRIQSREKKT